MVKVLTQEVYETTDGKVFTNKEEPVNIRL